MDDDGFTSNDDEDNYFGIIIEYDEKEVEN